MRKFLFVLFIVILAVSVALTVTWQAKSQTVMSTARTMLEQEAAKALGSSIAVGSIDIHGLSSVSINDIRLSDKQGMTLATANRLTVVFNPLLLLSGSNPGDAVHSITVEAPHLFLRQRADMRWNVEDLIKEKKGGTAQYGGEVIISRGVVSVETHNLGRYHADSVNGALDFKAKPAIQVDLKGNHNGSWFSVTGYVNGRTRDALTVSIETLALPEYRTALRSKSLEISAGVAKNVTFTAIREKEEFRFSGEAAIENLTGQADKMAVANASALVTIDQDVIRLYNADLLLWDQPLQLSGSIVYNAAQPVVDIRAKSEAFDAAALPLAIDLSGSIAFDMQIMGSMADLSAQGEVAIPAGKYQNYRFANAASQFVYAGDSVQLKGARVSLFDGQVTGDGVIDLRTMTSDLRITGRKVDGALIAQLAGIDKTNTRADFDILLRGGFSLATLDAAGSITLGSGQAIGVPFKGAYGGFHLQQGVLTADYFNAVIDSGMISAKGSWNSRQDNLAAKLEGHNLPLQCVAAVLPFSVQSSGSLHFAADISGKVADPRLKLTTTVEHGAISGQPFERITGFAEWSRDLIILRDILAVNDMTTHKIEGSVQLTGKREINLTLATRQARMETLLKAMPINEVITGNVDHDLSITGTLDNPAADGLLTLSDGSCRGYLLNNVKGSYRYRDGVADIQNAVVNSLDNQVIINGRVTVKGGLDLDIIGNDIDLARLAIPYPYPVSGKAKVAVNLNGTLTSPQISGQVIIPKLAANGQVFEKLEASVTINGDNLDSPGATFAQGQSTYSLTGGANLKTKEIYGSLRVEKAQASSIAALAKLNPNVVQGEIHGQFTWNGTLENPGATFSGSVAKGAVKGYNLGDIELEASLTNHVIKLDNLMIKQSGGLMAAKGQIDLRGDTNIEAGARDIDAAFFAKVFDSTIETKGRLSFTAQITGKSESPHTAISLEIANGSVANAGFDNLYGLLILDKGKIQVDQLLLSKGEYKASAYGVIPLAALNNERRQKASAKDEMNLTVRLDHANLSILPILTKAISTASGDTKGEVKLTGSLYNPRLNGQITVKDGAIKFFDIEEPIQKVTVDIQFKDDTIQVRTFEGALGSGKYSLTGSAALRDMAVHNYDMSLVLDKIALTHKYFKGPVNGQLTLREKKNMPHVSGKLLLANTTINIPVAPTASSSASNTDMGMDVELIVGDKVRLYNPMLYDVWVEGKVKFDGSLQEPDISGKIESVRGTLNYLRTQFRIDEATVAFTQFRSFEPVIALKASTRLEQTDVSLAVTGPVTAMDVKLTSDPQMSQQEVLSLLTLRNKFYERQASGKRDTSLGRDELVGMLDAGLQLQFFAEVEGMFRNSLGVDEFRLLRGESGDPLFTSDRTTTDPDQYRIEIGKYVSDRLMLSYSTGVNSSEKSYGARYDVTKQMSLTADIDEFDRLRLGVGMRFRF